MIKKIFSNEIDPLNNYLNQKIVQSVYSKSLVRKVLTLEDKILYVQDTGSSFLNLKAKHLNGRGKSFDNSFLSYQHKKNKKMNFQYFSNPRNKSFNALKSYYTFIYKKNKKNLKMSVYLKNRIKNGYKGFGGDSSGFLFYKQANVLLNNYNRSFTNTGFSKKLKVVFNKSLSLKLNMFIFRFFCNRISKNKITFLEKKNKKSKRFNSPFLKYSFVLLPKKLKSKVLKKRKPKKKMRIKFISDDFLQSKKKRKKKRKPSMIRKSFL